MVTLLWAATICCTAYGSEQEPVLSELNAPQTDSLVLLTTDGVKSIYLKNDIAQAQREFEAALALDSTYAPAHYSLSQLLLYNDPERSVHHAEIAYKSDTTNYWYLDNYGRSLVSNTQFEEAQTVFKQILEIKPNDLNSYRVLAILYQRVNEPEKAVALLDSAEVRVGNNLYLFELKRQILVGMNQVDRAIRETRELIDEAPYDPSYRVSLAEFYSRLGQDSLAYVEYFEALKIDSMSLTTLTSLGSFMNQRGYYDDYIVILGRIMRSSGIEPREKVMLVEELMSNRQVMSQKQVAIINLIVSLVEQYPNDPSVVQLLSNYHISSGNIEEGANVLKQHLKDRPVQFDYYRTVIDIERYLGRLDSLSLYIGEAVELFPDDETLPYEWTHTLVLQGRYDEAIAKYTEMLDESNDSLSSYLWCMIADTHLFVLEHDKQNSSTTTSGTIATDSKTKTAKASKTNQKATNSRLNSAFEAYEQSLKLQADNSLTLNNYAYAIVEYNPQKELDRALKMSEQAIELTTGNSMFLDTYAWILYKLDRYEEAKTTMRQAIALDAQKNPEIAMHYGAILFLLDELTMANYYWEKVIEWGGTEEMVAASRAEAEQRKLRAENSKK